ncbi:alanine/glycine:cation symporter family protein [Metabacillus litoralis]|jgi:alanine or glycine:cation symporter, AGCS family|uniref:alanine/glycine:cation symporter family protein n=1 Tax=Metabacillus litoralis TaxID=152268 RepID=UPI0020410A74|nr:sodium:alanine symporter family protein [Metabacillus litoralis]MCM3654311.1 sodium:alanine symporter family protein [Metabacillus litoralis]
MTEFITKISDIVWGPPLLILIVGTGLYLTFRITFLQFSKLPYALKLAFTKNQDKTSEGDISHFQSLMTALAATIGTGNIAGVATAVVLGGPGAVFWMWITALVGMATKYSEALLAVKYRTVGKHGEMAGGPMYYIEKGLGWKWLAVLFALFGAIAAFGIGSTVQSNSVAAAVESSFGVNPWITGIILMIATALVILGGIKNIGKVTAYFVPIMAIFYVVGGLFIIFFNISEVPSALALIFKDAFTGQAAAGGAIGTVIRYGVARGVFSNEAGMGSAPIAAAAAKTDHPGRQALISMTGTFLDTIVVCSITGITLVMGGLYTNSDISGAALTTQTFDQLLPGGGWIVTIGLIFFAYSTVLGWAYYGEKCFEYLFGNRSIKVYRLFYTLSVVVGAGMSLGLVWTLADIFNGLMAIPNLIALVALAGVVVAETKDFNKILAREKAEKQKSISVTNTNL